MMILCIEKTPAGNFANFKNYSSLPENCVLIISTNNEKFYKQNVYCNKAKGYDFKLPNDFMIENKVACVLIDKLENMQIIATGVNGDCVVYKSKILEYIDSFNKKSFVSKNKTNEDVFKDNSKIVNNDNLSESENQKFQEVIEENVENLSVENFEGETCVESAENKEKSIVFGVRDSEDIEAKESLFETDEKEIESAVDNEFFGENGSFYDMVKEQIDELFRLYPQEECLERVIPNSKWVKVDYEEGSNTYVLGLIYEMEILKYIAYGVPARYGDDMNGVLNGYSQWVPKDSENVDGDGYYIMFQDAITGKNIDVID